MDGHDTDGIVGAPNDDWAPTGPLRDDGAHLLEGFQLALVQWQVVDLVFSQDNELGQVDGVHALAQQLALGALLAAALDEGQQILEVRAVGIAGQGLRGR